MNAKDLINYLVPPLKLEETTEQATTWMDEFRLSELPVVDDDRFVGILNEEMIWSGEEKREFIHQYHPFVQGSRIHQDAHYFDVLKIAHDNGTKLVGITDDDEKYLGVVSVHDVIEAFANSSAITTPGAILVLEMEFRDYSLSEISRVVEEEEAKILSTQIVPDVNNPLRIKLTLKINTTQITQIERILEAKGFDVVDRFNTSEEANPDVDRYDAFMKYLRI